MPIIRSLPVKVILSVVLVLAVTLAVSFAIFLRLESQELIAAMMRETGQMAETILASLDRSMMENDNRHTLEDMKTLSSTNGVNHLMIVNRRGLVALSSHPEDHGEPLGMPEDVCTVCHDTASVERGRVFTVRSADGQEVFRNLTAILNRPECRACHRERFLGLLVTDITTASLRAHEASQIRRFVSVAAAVFGVVTLALLVLVHVLIRRPIGDLIVGTREMARGHYDFRLPERSSDELGALARSFNQMAAKVDQSRAILEKWNVSLEEEVERRTDELRRSNQQLETEKRQTESIVGSIAEGVLSVGRDGVVVLANAPAEEIFGRPDESVLGLPLAGVLKDCSEKFQNFEEVAAFMTAGDAAGDGTLGEVRQLSPRRRTYKVSRSRIESHRGEDRGWVFSFHDMTREKEIDEMKTNLVAMVSHELRTPLTAIKGALALLTDGKLEHAGEREEFLGIALTNTDRLIGLINNLLDLSKIESGSIFYEHGSFRLRPLLEHALEAVSSFARRNGVEISLDIQEEIQEVRGDSAKIEQVIVNLLSNAIKFSREGGAVIVGAAAMADEYMISVSDRGVGIPEKETERIFDKFYQVDMTSVRKVGGSGLGLAICKAIVQGHGGRIWVQSTLGSGSTFYFTLPKGRPGVVPRQAEPRPPAAEGEKVSRKVLVVEDESSVRKVLARYLEERGFMVLEAACAREALNMARTIAPDCITIDVMLPDLDGFDLTAVLRSDPRTSRIPIIFVTVVEGEGKEKGLRMGAAAYFTKPVQYEKVVEKIESTVGRIEPER